MQERALSSYEPPSISPPLFDGAKQKNDSEIEKSGKKVLTEGDRRWYYSKALLRGGPEKGARERAETKENQGLRGN